MMSFEYSKKLGLTNNNIQEAFDGAATIKAYNLQPVMSRKYHIAMQKLLKISNRIDAKQYHLEPVSRIIQELPIDIALLLGRHTCIYWKCNHRRTYRIHKHTKKSCQPIIIQLSACRPFADGCYYDETYI